MAVPVSGSTSGVAAERILQKLTGVKPVSTHDGDLGAWVAHCPAHDDGHQSLHISERNDHSVGIHDHAGCNKVDILNALGLTLADLFAAKSNTKQILATYDYRAIDGTLLYQSVRMWPKDFRQRRPGDNGEWIWDMQPLKGKHVPYRLPELQDHPVVVVVEGEKDADRLWKIGIAATTNVGGAKKWGSAETKALKAAGVQRVIVIPDNDVPGKEHAQLVGTSVKSVGIAVSVIELPDLPKSGDVSDWLANGGSKDALQALMASALYIVPPGAAPSPTPPPTVVDESPVVVAEYPALDLMPYHTTDLGAAETFRDRYGEQVRFDHQREMWLIWDGHFWRPDASNAVERLAHAHIRYLQRDATDVPDFLERKRFLDWSMGREKRGPMLAMLQQAAALLPIAISGESWDESPWLLGVENGVVDLQTGKARPGHREDFITLRSSVPYDGHSDCPRWHQFLLEVFDGDAELVDWIWRAVGYSLTADMREQCFFVLYGSGSNGKSIFIDTLETIFGTYGHRADMRMFAGIGVESNAFQNADFRGKRLVLAAEVRPGARMNEHILKHLTGGESLRAEFKYGRAFTIRPVGKIWLSVNHRPKVADDSYGFWRRVRMVPFTRTFSGSAEDRGLKATLRAEAPGILAWAVAGALEWQARGLDAPAVVTDATEAYQTSEDPLEDFVGARVTVGPETEESIVSLSVLYVAYRVWAGSMGMSDREKLTSKVFANLMASRFERVMWNKALHFKGLEVTSTGGSEGLPYDE